MDTGADFCWRREEHSGEVSQSRRFVCDSVSFCNEIPELNDNSRALQLKVGTEIVHTSNAISEAASRPAACPKKKSQPGLNSPLSEVASSLNTRASLHIE